MKKVIFFIMIGILILQLISCESSDPTAPDDSTILLSADPQTVRPDNSGYGESEIMAQVLDGSFNPIKEVGVIFSASPSGEFTSGGKPVLTDSNGRANDTLRTNAQSTVTARSGSASADIEIGFGSGNEAPNALLMVINNPTKTGEQVVFDGSGSIDTDGTIINYKWELYPDPETGDPLIIETSLDQQLVKYCYQEQSVVARLTVTDNDGAMDQDLEVLEVIDNLPPVANAGPDITQKLGGGVWILLDGGQSYDPDGQIVNFSWICGNGTQPQYPPSDPLTARCFYSATGTYNAVLTVYDDGGAMDSDLARVTVTE